MSRHRCYACGKVVDCETPESISANVGFAELLVPDARGGYGGWECCAGCVDIAIVKLREQGIAPVEVRMPHLDRARDTLADRVSKLEKRAADLDDLCGQMIATMLVNMKSGRLTTANDDEFGKMVESWSNRRMKA